MLIISHPILYYVLHGLKSPGIFQYVASLENEHDSFREVHLSLVYVISFRSFVYKLQSFKWRYFRLHSVPSYNAPSHTSLKAMAKLKQLRFELVAHPPYSPDLAPSDYYLFPNFKSCSRERDSHRMRKSKRKPKRISKA